MGSIDKLCLVKRPRHAAWWPGRVLRSDFGPRPPARNLHRDLDRSPARDPQREPCEDEPPAQNRMLRYDPRRRMPTASYTRIAGAFSGRTNKQTVGVLSRRMR